jgi:hypothetical protein
MKLLVVLVLVFMLLVQSMAQDHDYITRITRTTTRRWLPTWGSGSVYRSGYGSGLYGSRVGTGLYGSRFGTGLYGSRAYGNNLRYSQTWNPRFSGFGRTSRYWNHNEESEE